MWPVPNRVNAQQIVICTQQSSAQRCLLAGDLPRQGSIPEPAAHLAGVLWGQSAEGRAREAEEEQERAEADAAALRAELSAARAFDSGGGRGNGGGGKDSHQMQDLQMQLQVHAASGRRPPTILFAAQHVRPCIRRFVVHQHHSSS